MTFVSFLSHALHIVCFACFPFILCVLQWDDETGECCWQAFVQIVVITLIFNVYQFACARKREDVFFCVCVLQWGNETRESVGVKHVCIMWPPLSSKMSTIYFCMCKRERERGCACLNVCLVLGSSALFQDGFFKKPPSLFSCFFAEVVMCVLFCIAGNFRPRKILSIVTPRQFARNLFSSNAGRHSFALHSFGCRSFALHSLGRCSFAYRLFSHS